MTDSPRNIVSSDSLHEVVVDSSIFTTAEHSASSMSELGLALAGVESHREPGMGVGLERADESPLTVVSEINENDEGADEASLQRTAENCKAPMRPAAVRVPGPTSTSTSSICCAVCSKKEQLLPLKSLSPAMLPIVRAARPPQQQQSSQQTQSSSSSNQRTGTEQQQQQQGPNKPTHVCVPCLRNLLSRRLHSLMEEDARATGELGDAVMKNLGEWERTEGGWQKKFEKSRTLGEKAADGVAARGGSWAFVLTLIGCLVAWCILNTVLPEPYKWDPFPFILLNLFLSMLAAFQAPIIMMSQNRQDARDRIQSDFVSTMSLRAEHNIRHINAKLDHLIHGGWKRLLEIQEVQLWLMDPVIGGVGGGLLSVTSKNNSDVGMGCSSSSAKTTTTTGTLETVKEGSSGSGSSSTATPLPAASILRFSSAAGIFARSRRSASVLSRPSINSASLAEFNTPLAIFSSNRGANNESGSTNNNASATASHIHLSLPLAGSADRHLLHLFKRGNQLTPFVFTHWHHPGENFTCAISDVRPRFRTGNLRSIEYTLKPTDPSASLDDLLAGDGTVTLRNDLGLAEQSSPHGRILRLDVSFKGHPAKSFANGQVPPRYRTSFGMGRAERIAELWKWPVDALRVQYVPFAGHGAGVGWIRIARGKGVGGLRVVFTIDDDGKGARLWVKRASVDAGEGVLREVAEGKAGSAGNGWRLLFEHEWGGSTAEVVGASLGPGEADALGIGSGVEKKEGGSAVGGAKKSQGFMGAIASFVNSGKLGRQASVIPIATTTSGNPQVTSSTYAAEVAALSITADSSSSSEQVHNSQTSLESGSLLFDPDQIGSPSEALLIQDDAEGGAKTVAAELAPFIGAEEAEGDWVVWAEGLGRVEVDGWILDRAWIEGAVGDDLEQEIHR